MNIEKTISEHAVSDILTPMLESQDRIVTEDVAPLFDQATGLDTPPASGTVTTTIEESRSVITAIIRKAWTATLTMLGGASVIGYITAAYTYLRNRLQGNETYGIPDRRSEISASSPLAANLALLNDRKISEPNAIEGISLLHQLSDSSVALTKIEDTNRGWTLNKAYSLERIIALFPALTEIIYGCKYITQSLTNTRSAYTIPEKLSFNGLEECVSAPLITMGEGAFTGNKEMSFPDLKKIGCLVCYSGNGWWTSSISTDTLRFDALEEITSAGGGRGAFIEVPFPNLKKLDLSPVKSMGRPLYGGSCLQGLEELDLSGTSNVNLCHGTYPANISTALLLLKIKEGFAANLNLQYWSPTLDSSNLQQFLQNFRDYIANRLTDNGSGKTLTLSQAVHNAITAAEDDYHIREIITQKGWTISPAPN